MRLKVGVFARRGPATKARSVERRGFGASFCRYRILAKIVTPEHIVIMKVTESRPNCGAASSRRSECFNEELREHETVFVLIVMHFLTGSRMVKIPHHDTVQRDTDPERLRRGGRLLWREMIGVVRSILSGGAQWVRYP